VTTQPQRILAALTNLAERGQLPRPPKPTYSYLFPLPPVHVTKSGRRVIGLGGNARVHWRIKAALTAAYREEVVAIVQSTGRRPWEPLERARIHIEARYHNGREPKVVTDAATLRALDRYRPADRDNIRAACKPLIDALCAGTDPTRSAGVLAGDRALQLYESPLEVVTGVAWAEEGIYVTIEEMA
jgi:hypothetical protein